MKISGRKISVQKSRLLKNSRLTSIYIVSLFPTKGKPIPYPSSIRQLYSKLRNNPVLCYLTVVKLASVELAPPPVSQEMSGIPTTKYFRRGNWKKEEY